MIRQFNGYEAKKIGNREILPAGGYVAKVVSAKVEDTQYGQRLIIAFDIAEGDFRGFFDQDFKNNSNEDKKWRGVYRANIPADDGSEQDGWRKRTFGNMTWAFEESNPTFHWDWDETKLNGLTVGVLFRNKEWEYNGRTGWTTEACALTDVQSIRDGKFKTPKDKPLANKSNSYNDDLPFTYGGEADDLPI